MNGLTPKPEIGEKDLDKLLKLAHKDGLAYISVITPNHRSAKLTLRTHRAKGYNVVEIDTYSCNWDISDKGQKYFIELTKNYTEDIKEASCGKRIMRVSVKHDGEQMWGAGLWLTHMLGTLEIKDNLEEVSLK